MKKAFKGIFSLGVAMMIALSVFVVTPLTASAATPSATKRNASISSITFVYDTPLNGSINISSTVNGSYWTTATHSLEYRVKGTSKWTVLKQSSKPGTKFYKSVTGLKDGTTYEFCARAYANSNAGGSSASKATAIYSIKIQKLANGVQAGGYTYYSKSGLASLKASYASKANELSSKQKKAIDDLLTGYMLDVQIAQQCGPASEAAAITLWAYETFGKIQNWKTYFEMSYRGGQQIGAYVIQKKIDRLVAQNKSWYRTSGGVMGISAYK